MPERGTSPRAQRAVVPTVSRTNARALNPENTADTHEEKNEPNKHPCDLSARRREGSRFGTISR